MNTASLNHLIPLHEVPRLLPRCTRGRPVDVGTIRRWALKGKAGIRLQTWCVGRVRCTTLAALDEFFRATSGDGVQASSVSPGPRRSQSLPQDTYEVLERGGLLTDTETRQQRTIRGRALKRTRRKAAPAPP